jgi:hypothetical protein
MWDAVLPIAVLIAHCGPALPFPHVHGRLRCQACGSKDIHARPNWPLLGQVTRHLPPVRTHDNLTPIPERRPRQPIEF